MKSLHGGGAATIERRPAKQATDEWEFHPLTKFLPPATEEQLEEMAEDLRRVGMLTVLTNGGVVLDDPSRLEACKRAGVEIECVAWDGVGSSAEVVARAVIPRLLLSESQRAAVAVGLVQELSLSTTSRRNAALKRGKQQSGKTAFSVKSPVGANLPQRGISQKTRFSEIADAPENDSDQGGRAAEVAALNCRVSATSVKQAISIFERSPEIFEQVRRGKLNLCQARVELSKIHRQKKLADVPTLSASLPQGDDRLIIGDCLVEMPKLPRASVNLIFADPPYNNGWKYDSDPTRDKLPEQKYLDWCWQWIQHCDRLLADDGSIFVLIDARHAHRLGVLLSDAGLHWRNTIIFRDTFPMHTDKNFQPAAKFLFYFTKNPNLFTWNADAVRVPSARDVLGDKRRVHNKGIVPHNFWEAEEDNQVPSNIWAASRRPGNAGDAVPFGDRPPQTPPSILERIILACSNPGDRIGDPFTGNGTTWRAARKLGRKFTGVERSPKYAGQARQWAMS